MKTTCELKTINDRAVVMAHQNGAIIYVNRAFNKLFGWAEGEIIGHPLNVIIPKLLQDAHNMGFARFLLTEKPTLLGQALPLVARKKNNAEFKIELTIFAEKEADQWIFGSTIRPITE